jgi:hypothetical protein
MKFLLFARLRRLFSPTFRHTNATRIRKEEFFYEMQGQQIFGGFNLRFDEFRDRESGCCDLDGGRRWDIME